MNLDSLLPLFFSGLVVIAALGAIFGFCVLLSVAFGLVADAVRRVFHVR